MKKDITIPSSLKNIGYAVEEILGPLKNAKANESDLFDVRLCLEETLINAIKYGNRLNESLAVDIGFVYDGGKAVITIEDKGKGFDYSHMPDPTKEENLLKTSGRGIFLVRHLMDKVEFNKKGNRITMTKHLKKGKGP